VQKTIDWLLQGDPAIRWQTMRDLTGARRQAWAGERQCVCRHGWVKRLLDRQDRTGTWGGGLYSPKWMSTTYTMLLLRRLGLPPTHPKARAACRLLLEKGLRDDGGICFSPAWGHSETCETGLILSVLAYFRYPDERIDRLVEHLFVQQLPDGGWNCQSYRGARHSSFHTTICALEGLLEYHRLYPRRYPRIGRVQDRGREFLLEHRLFRSSTTGEVVKPAMTRFSFPPRWHYDVLRGLDHFQEAVAERDRRLQDAIDLVHKKRRADGRWPLQNRHPGKTFFEIETPGRPSRWNTLRALRVLRWWAG
jgi:hypothetical protein